MRFEISLNTEKFYSNYLKESIFYGRRKTEAIFFVFFFEKISEFLVSSNVLLFRKPKMGQRIWACQHIWLEHNFILYIYLLFIYIMYIYLATRMQKLGNYSNLESLYQGYGFAAGLHSDPESIRTAAFDFITPMTVIEIKGL